MAKMKILLISPSFFGYIELIKKEFENQGINVQLFFETFTSSSYVHIYQKFVKLNSYLQKRHLKKILKKCRNFDVFVMIKGQYLNEAFIRELKSLNPKSKFIMYQWDSKKVFDYSHYYPYFDQILSFDILDCQKDKKIKLIPTFGTMKYSNYDTSLSDYDIFFIGTDKPFRRQLLEKLAFDADEIGISYRFYLLSIKQYVVNIFKKGNRIKYIIKPFSKGKNQFLKIMRKTKAKHFRRMIC
jgi:hypothetical protein